MVGPVVSRMNTNTWLLTYRTSELKGMRYCTKMIADLRKNSYCSVMKGRERTEITITFTPETVVGLMAIILEYEGLHPFLQAYYR